MGLKEFYGMTQITNPTNMVANVIDKSNELSAKRGVGRPPGKYGPYRKGPILSAHMLVVLEANNGIMLRELVHHTIADAILNDGQSRKMVFERIEGKVPDSIFINAGDAEEDRTAIVSAASALLDSLKPITIVKQELDIVDGILVNDPNEGKD